MINVVLIGSGNVAKHLFKALQTSNNATVIQCYNRKNIDLNLHCESTKTAVITTNIAELLPADLYILAVSDTAINTVSEALPFTDRLVVHTSGGMDMAEIDSKQRGGVFYPLQTFSKGVTVDFKKIPFCLETEQQEDYTLLAGLAQAIGSPYQPISSAQRNVLHVAAVYVNNFTNYLFTAAAELCEAHTISFEILQPLIEATVQKITVISPKAAQTGPAKRGDFKTINRHQEILKDQEQKKIYQLLSEAILREHGKKL